jgi:2-dehydro-3-deoxygalactonokinase
MRLPEKFISCDWGTSNFRLRLVDTLSLKVLSEHTSDMGIKKRFQQFKAQQQLARDHFFVAYLREKIEDLSRTGAHNHSIVASGMLSSSIGMQELPYADMPILFSGENLISKSIHPDKMPKVLLISGVKTDTDVMRGEETQAIGLSDHLPIHGRGILLLPGTHSKHIIFEAGRFEDFTTHMTGELFEVISRYSILSASLEEAEWNPSYEEIFLKGVKKGLANRQTASLFRIRAGSLIHNTSGDQNYYYLSGLLIGGELSNLKTCTETVYLAATGIYHSLYRLALKSFLPTERMVCFDAEILEKALLIGQRKILETYG